MNLSDLWDIQVLAYVGITASVTLLMLILLAVISRRVRVMASELESIRREMRLLDEGVRTVSESLQARRVPQPIEVAENPEPAPQPGEPAKPAKPA